MAEKQSLKIIGRCTKGRPKGSKNKPRPWLPGQLPFDFMLTAIDKAVTGLCSLAHPKLSGEIDNRQNRQAKT